MSWVQPLHQIALYFQASSRPVQILGLALMPLWIMSHSLFWVFIPDEAVILWVKSILNLILLTRFW